MKLKVTDIDNKAVGEVEIDDAVYADIFGREVRKDLLARAVNWQLAKRRAGTHKTKEIGDVQGTTKKPYNQKGTGNARQGSLRSPQFRGGATIFGPVPRSHAHDLPKKVRKLALKTALSAKQAEGKLVIWSGADASGKTKDLSVKFGKLGWKSVLVIDGTAVNEKFALAARNIPGIDVLPQQGANVYDILRRDTLVLTKGAMESLVERLK
jgi:large subunit ribosomal protein L4